MSRAALLPLKEEHARTFSIRHYLALAQLREGLDVEVQVRLLSRAVLHARAMTFINDAETLAVLDSALEELESFLPVGHHASDVARRDDGFAATVRALSLFDTHMATLPSAQFLDAWERSVRQPGCVRLR